MFKWLRIFRNKKHREKCNNCSKSYRTEYMVEFAGMHFCSEKCMAERFKNMSTEELLSLDKVDREMIDRYE